MAALLENRKILSQSPDQSSLTKTEITTSTRTKCDESPANRCQKGSFASVQLDYGLDRNFISSSLSSCYFELIECD